MKNHQLALLKNKKGFSNLRLLASNGSFEMAGLILKKMRKRSKKSQTCYLCNGLFKKIDILANSAVEKLEEYEFSTFLVGIELSNKIEEKEDEFKAHFDVSYSESMRNEFSREIGKKIVQKTNKMAEYQKPDIVVLINPMTEYIFVQPNPLYIKGYYRKLVRGIPQSKWFCKICRGNGCSNCNGTGKMYLESIEEIISKPLLDETEGLDAAFHAAGREDVDARMLGNGRPFIMEIKKPKKRFINLKEVRKEINLQAKGKAEVSSLNFATKTDVKRLKISEGVSKMYRVVVDFNRIVSDEELKKITDGLTQTTILQQTPLRVLHRRADLIREKYIYETHLKRLTPNRVEMKIRCQGGLYIKELVSGDRGRTLPSVSSIINVEAKPIDLDVIRIFMEE
jgi:tRNA pseudouridine synthase 10